MTMIRVRKEHAGDAAGRTGGAAWSYDWPEDGAVLEVPYEVALEVLAIAHGGFSVAQDEPAPETADDLEPGDATGDEDDETQVEEPSPEAPLSESPAPRPAKKSAAKKTAAAPPVEE